MIPRSLTLGVWLLLAAALVVDAAPVSAADRYALVITGASGGSPYKERYDAWRETLVKTFEQTFHYPADHIVVLAEEASETIRQATRENVRAVVGELRARLGQDDTLTVVLIGHGSSAGGDAAKFNLVGPDLTAAEWGALCRDLPGQLVFVNTSSGSFPFVEALSGRNHIVITANDSAAQQFETVFPEYFIETLAGTSADTDKDGRVSVWELFVAVADRVKRYYQENGQLATERPLLDDNGDGIGREFDEPGPDGVLSRVAYFETAPEMAGTGDPERTALMRRRAQVLNDFEQLRAKKAQLPTAAYEDALEALLLELARIDRRLRAGS
ncbi:MAG: hypothetical protein LBQ09_04575 [Acidobacteriaceae bacterium]|nr:hypothetical protein [Acidobacteriaceae bacterium]